ncbi:MAG: ATP-binding cassette domain-containing protein, partial [Planctomycetota bacterium]
MIRRPRLPGSRNRKGDGPRAANDQAAGTSRPSTLSALTFLEFKLGHRVRGGARMIVDGASLDLPAGEMLLFAGPSGAGKSSLLRAILGLDDPYRPRSVLGGELRVLGEAVDGRRNASGPVARPSTV